MTRPLRFSFGTRGIHISSVNIIRIQQLQITGDKSAFLVFCQGQTTKYGDCPGKSGSSLKLVSKVVKQVSSSTVLIYLYVCTYICMYVYVHKQYVFLFTHVDDRCEINVY